MVGDDMTDTELFDKEKLILKEEGGSLFYSRKTLSALMIAATVMLLWIYVWALVFKLGSEIILTRNYESYKDMTYGERILWDLIPFNYRGTDYSKMRQIIDTVLNSFVFAPLGVSLCYVFEKVSVWRNAAICLGCSVVVETLQLFTVFGNPATEDLITNVLGGFIGYAVYQLLLRRISLRKSVILAIIANAALVAAVIFSFVTLALASDLILKILTKTL